MNAITALALHKDAIFAATNDGVYRLPDGHLNWQTCFDDQRPATCLHVVSDALFVGLVGGVRYSYDGGLSAITRTLSSPPPFPVVIASSPVYEDDGVIVMGTLDDGLFRSDDRGQYWTPWNFGLLELEVLALVFIDPETLLAGTSGGIFRSTNGGRAWRETTFSTDHAPVLSLAYDGARAWAGTERGLFFSEDAGLTWHKRLDGLVNQVGLTPAGRMILWTENALLVSGDAGSTWQSWLAVPPEIVPAISAVTVCGENALLLGLEDGRVLRAEYHGCLSVLPNLLATLPSSD